MSKYENIVFKALKQQFSQMLTSINKVYLQISTLPNIFYNQYLKRLKKMAQSVPIGSFDSEIIYDSEESIHQKHCEDSFLDQVLEKGFEEESETGIKRDSTKKKTKQILKPTIVQSPTPLFPVAINPRKRNNTKSGKWSGSNRTNYYKSILKFSTQHPYYTISWKHWKPEKFYPKMIEQINKNETYYKKDVIQTKSFDERQRKEYFEKEPGLDMIDLSLMKLRQVEQMDDSLKEVIMKFEQKRQEKSQHMELLDELITKLNQKKYDIDDLYYKIMGRQPIMAGDQNNSVFYS